MTGCRKMIISEIFISRENKIKIFEKHNVLAREIKEAIMEDKPIFRKVAANQYICIGQSKSRHLTVFFEHSKDNSIEITTAYPSSKSQIKFYKKAK